MSKEKFKNKTREELIDLIDYQQFIIKTLNEKIEKLEEMDGAWTKEDAQRDGGGFTTEELLEIEREHY